MKDTTEAPVSLTVKGYYKGFSVMSTKRDPKEKSLPLLEDAILTIDWMIEKGFKPSWNEQTNGKVEKPSQVNKDECQHVNTTQAVSQSEKNPNRKFVKCKDCGGFVGWV